MNLSEPKIHDPESVGSVNSAPGRITGFFVGVSALIFVFGRVLFELAQFSARSDLYSYILIVPPICLYLYWSSKTRLQMAAKAGRGIAAIFFACAVGALYGSWDITRSATPFERQDYLVWSVLSLVLFFVGIFAFYFGPSTLRKFAFPLGFLFFIIPIPTGVESAINTGLQNSSAEVARVFFNLLGTPVVYHSLVFQLPGIVIQVAPECSGIHSSLILFLTSLLASHFFLSTPWKQVVLVAAVIPLAVVRNAVRIFTIGELCVQIRPEMIHSYIHHHGGPIFFLLSLVPFSLLLLYLWRSDRLPQKKKLDPVSV